MIILDENIPESQRLLLIKWRIKFRQIGVEIGRTGIQDDAILALLGWRQKIIPHLACLLARLLRCIHRRIS